MKRINLIVSDEKRAQFKSKAAAEYLTMSEVLNWAIDDYLSGKWKPRPYNRQEKKGKGK